MSQLSTIPNQDYDRSVTCVDLDERFLLVGKSDGSVSCVYTKNGLQVFSEQISSLPITAVCCDKHDEDDDQVFYAGDLGGTVMVITKKGKILNKQKLSGGEISAIVNYDQYSIQVHTNNGSDIFSDTAKDFKKEESSLVRSIFSYDPDGTIYQNPEQGRFKVVRYLCKSSSAVVVTIAIEFGEVENDNREVFAYSINDNDYKDLIDDGTAQNSLYVFSKNIIRCISFESAVKQVISYGEKARADTLYILLWNGKIMKVNSNKKFFIRFKGISSIIVHLS